LQQNKIKLNGGIKMNIKLDNVKLPTKKELEGEFDWYNTHDGYQEAVYSILIGGSFGIYIPAKLAELLECDNFPNPADECYWSEMECLMSSANEQLAALYDSNVYISYLDSDGSLGLLIRKEANANV
jgi:hypothetical protein